jgi:hypothetical protein
MTHDDGDDQGLTKICESAQTKEYRLATRNATIAQPNKMFERWYCLDQQPS